MSRFIRSSGRNAFFWNFAVRRRTGLTSRFKHHDSTKMTVVERAIHDNIKLTGPISFARYMKLCLSHPTHGYYMNKQHAVLGQAGDFITSPEISQTFGEMIALWFYAQYTGRKELIRIVELGPGRGSLMADILRVLSNFTRSQTLDVHLVETSPNMRALQEQKLGSLSNVQLHWHNSIAEIQPSSKQFTFLVAHEFFDALPIYVIRRTEKGWHDMLVATTEDNPDIEATSVDSPSSTSSSEPTLRPVLASEPSAPASLLGQTSARFRELPVGATLEVSPDSFRIARKVGELLESGKSIEGNPSVGGCGLIVDYGGDQAFSDSFRAFKNHQAVDVFDKPGECDLTANVDFAFLREAMQDIVTVSGPLPQGVFLERMGISLRTDALVNAAKSEERKAQIRKSKSRLVDLAGMGNQYTFLGIVGKQIHGEEYVPYPFDSSQGKQDIRTPTE